MRIFFNEMKKLWNWRILLVLAVIAVPFSIVFLYGTISGYNGLTHYGIFGEYQNEMFEQYGETLEPEEWADFNIEGKRSDIIGKANRIIAENPVFTENGVRDWEGYLAFMSPEESSFTPEQEEAWANASHLMRVAFSGSERLDIKAEYESPPFLLQSLDCVKRFYADYDIFLDVYKAHDERPVVAAAAKQISASRNGGLVNGYLTRHLSMYAASVGIFAVIAVIILVAPILVTDHSLKITMLQYSSKTGRRLPRVQLAATLTSAVILSVTLCTLSAIPWLFTDAPKYWDAHLMQYGSYGFFLYNITFGRYAQFLFGAIIALCIAASGIAFVLARFSANTVTLLLKAVPAGAAISALAYYDLYNAFHSENWIFTLIFRGRVVAPEAWVCMIVAILGIAGAVFIERREVHIDLA